MPPPAPLTETISKSLWLSRCASSSEGSGMFPAGPTTCAQGAVAIRHEMRTARPDRWRMWLARVMADPTTQAWPRPRARSQRHCCSWRALYAPPCLPCSGRKSLARVPEDGSLPRRLRLIRVVLYQSLEVRHLPFGSRLSQESTGMLRWLDGYGAPASERASRRGAWSRPDCAGGTLLRRPGPLRQPGRRHHRAGEIHARPRGRRHRLLARRRHPEGHQRCGPGRGRKMRHGPTYARLGRGQALDGGVDDQSLARTTPRHGRPVVSEPNAVGGPGSGCLRSTRTDRASGRPGAAEAPP